ncbi:MAG: magnesium transporter [Clostridia bacterium]
MNELRELLKTGSPRELRRRMADLHAVDIAQTIEDVDEDEVQLLITLLAMMNDRQVAQVLEQLGPSDQLRLSEHMTDTRLRSVIQFVSPDELADFLTILEADTVWQLLSALPDQKTIRRLMQYPETSAGGIMTTDYLSFRADQSCGQVLNFYRRLAREVEAAYYIYITDEDGSLVGVTSLRELVLANPERPIAEIARTEVVTVTPMMDQEEVASIMTRYDFVALPVIDGDNRLLGVITFDDIIDVIEQEVSEDMARMGGVEPSDEPYLAASVLSVVRRRIWWLLILFLAQTITGNILDHFQGYIEAVVALSFFIPLLIGTGGNAGAQAASTVIRAMALDEVQIEQVGRVIWREIRSGLLLGIIMGAAALVQASLLGGSPLLGYTVAAALFIIVIMASILGGMLPLIARRLGFDPAAASAPVITTLVDGTGLIVYFMVARFILGL